MTARENLIGIWEHIPTTYEELKSDKQQFDNLILGILEYTKYLFKAKYSSLVKACTFYGGGSYDEDDLANDITYHIVKKYDKYSSKSSAHALNYINRMVHNAIITKTTYEAKRFADKFIDLLPEDYDSIGDSMLFLDKKASNPSINNDVKLLVMELNELLYPDELCMTLLNTVHRLKVSEIDDMIVHCGINALFKMTIMYTYTELGVLVKFATQNIKSSSLEKLTSTDSKARKLQISRLLDRSKNKIKNYYAISHKNK